MEILYKDLLFSRREIILYCCLGLVSGKARPRVKLFIRGNISLIFLQAHLDTMKIAATIDIVGLLREPSVLVRRTASDNIVLR